MSDLKYLVLVLAGTTLLNIAFCQLQPLYGYPSLYPYQPGYQAPLPYQSFGSPNFPVGGSQIYPSYGQSYPYASIPSYNPYGSGYPSFSYPSAYPSYPSYPSYPTYPPRYQNYPDPYAHIPTDIIDIKEDGTTVDAGISFDELSPKFDISSSHHSSALGPSHLPLGVPITTSNVVTTKPLQTVISRIYGSDSLAPEINIQNPESNSQPGSGKLIEADAEEEEVAKSNDAEDQEAENAVKSAEEKQEEEEKEDKEEGTGYFNPFG